MDEKGRRDGGRERGKTSPLHTCKLNKETRIRKVTRRGLKAKIEKTFRELRQIADELEERGYTKASSFL